jgi:thiamine pyrophosphokinase
MEGRAFIFLNGFYPKSDNSMIRDMIRKARPAPVLIAVDGGIAFMQKNGLKPDFWISDLDSAPRLKKGFLEKAEVLLYPADKDKTDAELALDVCAKEGLSDVTVFGWEAREGETDHLLGSLFLCRNLKGKRRLLNLRFIDSRQEIIPLRDETRIFRGYKGKRLSLIPLSTRIVLTLGGTRYPACELVVRAGETVSLRNRITAQRATVAIQGSGLAVIT